MPIHRRFDLKGSTMGRSASASDKEKGHRCILKDLDFLELNDNIKLGSARKRAFLDQIRRDCHVLLPDMSSSMLDWCTAGLADGAGWGDCGRGGGGERRGRGSGRLRVECGVQLLMSLKIMDYSLLLGVHFEDGTGPDPRVLPVLAALLLGFC
eukprot:2849963-Rhodomonas_salina.2